MKKIYSWVRILLRQGIVRLLKKFSYVHIEEFTKPYIIQKHIEGVDFLFSIRDSHAKLWYDLYCTDPVWMEMRFIRDNLVCPGDVVIECGSHHGCTAILLANWIGPEGIIHAYEPGKSNYEILKENIVLNNILNINPINEAVGNDNSFVTFIEFANSSMGSKVECEGYKYNKKQAVSYEIKQVSLDKYASMRPALIKIDTQGYVYQPLVGAKKLIEEQKPNLALEIDARVEINRYGNNFETIFEIINHHEYTFFIQFESEEPEQIEFSKILIEWEKEINLLKKFTCLQKTQKDQCNCLVKG